MIRSNTRWQAPPQDSPRLSQAEVRERFEGEPVWDAPWDFPPGTPGSSSGPEVPEEFLDWLRTHDERMCVTWQPVTENFVIWLKTEAGHKCITPVVNPFSFEWADLQPGQAMPLDRRIKAILIDSDPATYGGEKEMLRYAQDRQSAHQEAQADRALEAMKEARHLARLRTRISIGYGGNRGSKVSEMYK